MNSTAQTTPRHAATGTIQPALPSGATPEVRAPAALLTIPEAAFLARVSARTIQRLVKARPAWAYRFGAAWRIDRERWVGERGQRLKDTTAWVKFYCAYSPIRDAKADAMDFLTLRAQGEL